MLGVDLPVPAMRALAVLVLLAAASVQAQTAGDPPGLGFAFAPGAEGLLVQALAEDGPATGSGLRIGDIVTAVSGKPVGGMETGELAAWLRAVGQAPLPSVLEVQRDGETLRVEITPAPYSRAALAAQVEARSASGLDGASAETALALFDGAMNQPPVYRRASREGADLVVASSTCTVRIPVTPATTVEPSATSETTFRVNAPTIRVQCSGDPYTNNLVNFDLATRAMRDRAVETARVVVRTWAAGDDLDEAPSRTSAPTPAAAAAPAGDVCVSGTCVDGAGTLRYASGQVFTGTFQGGRAVRGRFAMTDGSTYEGAFNVGQQFHGEGLFTFGPGDFEGDTFEGTFADGAPAHGTYTWAEGQTYTGQWDGWVRTGQGLMRYRNGNAYEGGWHEGRRHGTGTFTFASGLTFVGDWVDDARVRGREAYASGNVYDGEYADDKRHGRGTMTYAGGNVYEGDWVEGNRVGQGTFTWSDGKVYTGSWAGDGRSGQGVMTWPSGQRYEGSWSGDKRQGQGTMTYADGRIFVGTWTESQEVEGTLQQPNGPPRPVRVEGGQFVYTDR